MVHPIKGEENHTVLQTKMQAIQTPLLTKAGETRTIRRVKVLGIPMALQTRIQGVQMAPPIKVGVVQTALRIKALLTKVEVTQTVLLTKTVEVQTILPIKIQGIPIALQIKAEETRMVLPGVQIRTQAQATMAKRPTTVREGHRGRVHPVPNKPSQSLGLLRKRPSTLVVEVRQPQGWVVSSMVPLVVLLLVKRQVLKGRRREAVVEGVVEEAAQIQAPGGVLGVIRVVIQGQARPPAEVQPATTAPTPAGVLALALALAQVVAPLGAQTAILGPIQEEAPAPVPVEVQAVVPETVKEEGPNPVGPQVAHLGGVGTQVPAEAQAAVPPMGPLQAEEDLAQAAILARARAVVGVTQEVQGAALAVVRMGVHKQTRHLHLTPSPLSVKL